MGEERASRIRAAVAQHGRVGRGNPYPDMLKSEAVEFFRARKRAGIAAAQIAREVGISAVTLGRWDAECPPRLLPVVISGGEDTSRLVVLGPCGVRIEGLDVSSLARLLRELA